MGISHVKPAKLSTRTGWFLPVGMFTDLEMLPNTRKGATYTHAISFSLLKVNPGCDPRPV